MHTMCQTLQKQLKNHDFPPQKVYKLGLSMNLGRKTTQIHKCINIQCDDEENL